MHGCIVSTVTTDALVFKHQAISIHNADKTFIVLDQFHIKILHIWWRISENEITFWKMTWSFNSLWPSDAIWQHRTWSTLAQVTACCLTAPSHYLNQCWLIISKVQSHSSGNPFTKYTSAINHWNQFENYLSKFSFKSPRGQWVMC